MCKNLNLLAYKSADSARKNGELLFSVHLKGCEVTPALNLTANKFEVKLEVPSTEGMTEMFLRFISVSRVISLHSSINSLSCVSGESVCPVAGCLQVRGQGQDSG